MITDFKPHPKQQQILDSMCRYIVAISGIQGGKTIIGGIWLCKEIYKAYVAGKRGDWLIAAPIVKILQQSTLPKFKQIIPSDWGVWRENRQVFDLAWGDHIFVRSTDNPDYLEGMTLLGAWLDEAGQMKQNVWINVQGRVSINQGRVLITTTPYSLNWIYKDLMKKAGTINGETVSDGDKDISLVSWQSVNNPAFPKEEFDRAQRTLNPVIFKRRYCGEFTQLEGLVYPDFTEDSIVEPFEIPHGWKRFGGIDFGKTNPTAIVCVAEDPKTNTFYAYREFYKSESLLKQVAEFIKDEGLKYVLGDPQSAQLIMELNRSYQVGCVQPADNDITVGIERLTTLLKEGRLKVLRTCDNLIEELQTYHYPRPDDEGYVKDKPVAKDNHACDAFRYSFSKNMSGKKLYRHDALDLMPKKRYTPNLTRRDFAPDPWTGY